MTCILYHIWYSLISQHYGIGAVMREIVKFPLILLGLTVVGFPWAYVLGIPEWSTVVGLIVAHMK
jgi:hypothetical protein